LSDGGLLRFARNDGPPFASFALTQQRSFSEVDLCVPAGRQALRYSLLPKRPQGVQFSNFQIIKSFPVFCKNKQRHLKTLFNIQGASSQQPEVLLLELGADQVKFALYSPEQDRFSHIRIYETNEFDLENDLVSILKELSQRQFAKVMACSSFPQAMLLPRFKSGDHAELFQNLFPEPVRDIIRDEIPEWQMANVYAFPLEIREQLERSFPGLNFIHNFSCYLKNYNGYDQDDQVAIDFSTRNFRVLVKKQSNLQLAQVYSYVRPLDVVYYLLKIISEMGLDQSKTLLVLSGLVEKDSAMYQLLNDYFSQIVFAGVGKTSFPENELPSHFFASIKNLAACAS
jgi:hypothetical protein